MSFEESAVETYCELCQKILNPPYIYAEIHSGEVKRESAVCTTCNSYLERITQIINEHKIGWGQISKTGEKWLRTSRTHHYMQKNGRSIETYLNLSISPNDEESIEKDVMTGRTDPEVFEWEYLEIIKRVMKPSYREDLKKVLRAYCAKNPNIGYCQGMNYVAMWLLLFLDVNSSFFVLSYLVESWLLPDFYVGSRNGNSLNGFYIESTTISSFLEFCIPAMRSACMPSDQFSDFFSLQLMIQLFVNTVSFETCIFLWDKLMEEGSISLIRGTVALVYISEDYIKEGEHPLNILKSIPVARIRQRLEDVYESLKERITSKAVDNLRQKARDYRAGQWQKCEKIVNRKLEKISNFNEAEITKIRDIFFTFLKEKKIVRDTVRYTIELPSGVQESFNEIGYRSGISKNQFLEIVSGVNPKLKNSAEMIFDRFDEDKSSYLDLRELTLCISVMSKGDFDEKLKVCFDAYDQDKSGFLQPNEMEDMIRSLTKPYLIETNEENLFSIEEFKEKMRIICQKSGDILFFRDFLYAIKADPMLFACFSDHFNIDFVEIQQFTLEKKSERRTSRRRDSAGFSSCKKCVII